MDLSWMEPGYRFMETEALQHLMDASVELVDLDDGESDIIVTIQPRTDAPRDDQSIGHQYYFTIIKCIRDLQNTLKKAFQYNMHFKLQADSTWTTIGQFSRATLAKEVVDVSMEKIRQHVEYNYQRLTAFKLKIHIIMPANCVLHMCATQ